VDGHVVFDGDRGRLFAVFASRILAIDEVEGGDAEAAVGRCKSDFEMKDVVEVVAAGVDEAEIETREEIEIGVVDPVLWREGDVVQEEGGMIAVVDEGD
jgi:hypothetical protein